MKSDIGCFGCGWEDKSKLQWYCTCGCIWNTFETNCICPICKRKWDYIQCPNCAYPRHKYAYERTSLENISYANRICTNESYLHSKAKMSVAEYYIIEEAWCWVKYYSFKISCDKPNSVIIAERKGICNKEIFSMFNNLMEHIIQGKGKSLSKPLHCITYYYFNNLINLLGFKIKKSGSSYSNFSDGIEINEYLIESTKNNEIVSFFASFIMDPNKRTY